MAAQTDNFATDPTSRWTFESGSATWDSGNSEYDFDSSAITAARYLTSPGNIEHEAQVTAVEGTSRTPYCAVRMHNAGTNDECYWIHSNGDGNFVLARYSAGGGIVSLATWALSRASGDFITWRLAAEGTNGNNVVLSAWATNHGSTKPSDPGWIGVDGSPGYTYTDTAAERNDDGTVHLQCGVGGRNGAGDHDTRHSYWKARNITDRGGGGAGQPAGSRSQLDTQRGRIGAMGRLFRESLKTTKAGLLVPAWV